MPEPLAFIHGQFVPQSQLGVPVHDQGFLLGATVAEQLRTFNGKVFRLEAHLERLERSLHIVGLESAISRAQLTDIATELVQKNHALLPDGHDLGLTIFVTPGPSANIADAAYSGPLVCVHTLPLQFRLWAEKYS